MVARYLIRNNFIGVKAAKHGIVMFKRSDPFIGRSLDLQGEPSEPELLPLVSACCHRLR